MLRDMAFLYSGSQAVQSGLVAEALSPARVGVARGRVLDRAGQPLAGVQVRVLSHPEYGQAHSRADGTYDLVLHGGGPVVLDFSAEGYLNAQRHVTVPWQDWGVASDVVLTPADPTVTTVALGQPTMQVARGSVVADARGSRQATLVVPAGTQATMFLPDGTTAPLPQMDLRITEFTVGERGPEAMPAELPPTTGYTYAVELNADEAVAAGADEVLFDKPLSYYVDNFLGFPVGTPVPVGCYDRQEGVWKTEDDGLVVRVLAEDGGSAVLAVDGTGQAATPEVLVALGVTDEELQHLAALYEPGQELWRVRIPHFTQPYDFNYGIGVGPGAVGPGQDEPVPGLLEELGDAFGGFGTVEALDQTLHEALPLAGTAVSLNYRSDRISGCGAAYSTDISLSGDAVPESLKEIVLEVEVAGRVLREAFLPSANQRTTFTWDGMDAYGRRVQGPRPARVRVGYVYQGYYLRPPYMMRNFGVPGGQPMTDLKPAGEITRWQTFDVSLGNWDNQGAGLGGWTLSAHHVLDRVRGVVYLGDGGEIRLNRQETIATAAGNGLGGDEGDGGPATEASLFRPKSVAVAPDGSVLVLANGLIRQVAPSGIISTIAGAGSLISEGVPAAQSRFWDARDIAFGPDGSLYVCEWGACRVRRIDPDGVIRTVIGYWGQPGYGGDGGPATQARLNWPRSIAVGPDGSLYIADGGNLVVRRVSPDGTVQTVPGSRASSEICSVAVARDGTLYAGTTSRIMALAADGTVRHFAGGNTTVLDGALAVDTRLGNPGLQYITVGRAGEVYVVIYDYGTDPSTQPCRVVRRIDQDGRIFTVAGVGPQGQGGVGDGGTPRQAHFNVPVGVAQGPDGSLYIADRMDNRVRRVFMSDPIHEGDDLLVPSEDGNLVYRFDSDGRHLRTENALTGATLLSFDYSGGGLLTAVMDASGNRLTVERSASGTPLALVAPYGQRTSLTLGGDGNLNEVTNPAGETVRLSYGDGGLMTGLVDPRNASYRFTYDQGRVVKADHPGGGGIAMIRQVVGGLVRVQAVTTMGLTSTSTFQVLPDGTKETVVVHPDGTRSVLREALDKSGTATSATGTTSSWTVGPDPRYGMRVPLLKSSVTTTPRGLATRSTFERQVGLDSGGRLVTLTDRATVKGRTGQVEFDLPSLTVTSTSPAGRQSSATVDAVGRTVEVRPPQVEPSHYTYDERGRLVQVTQGEGDTARTMRMAYGTDGMLAAVTDSLGRTVGQDHDATGRLVRTTLPDGRTVRLGPTATGRLGSLTPPGRPAHTFDYTGFNGLSRYTPPPAGGEAGSASYEYDADRRLAKATRLGGQVLQFTYDAGGRPSQDLSPEGSLGYSWNASGLLAGLTDSSGGSLSYSYDGGLPLQVTAAGAVSGTVSVTYDQDLRVRAQTVSGTPTLALDYDPDGLLIQAGELALTPEAASGRLAGTSLRGIGDSWTYDEHGDPASYSVPGLLELSWVHDAAGRVTERTETVQGETHTWRYGYDLDGRLEEVDRDGSSWARYTFDSNDNRLSRTDSEGTETGTFDDRDRVLTYGGATYTWKPDGSLKSRSLGGQTTALTYDSGGSLLHVGLPGGSSVDYQVDALGRRVTRSVDGQQTQGFLYGGGLGPVAELDGQGAVRSRFVYATRPQVPDFMVRDGRTYRLLTDLRASVRLVVDAATGEVAQRLDYDEYGRVLQDTCPGFQPFGFAGGLYDPATGLVRFGARDYDPQTGRFTAADPQLFGGGDTNLYNYALCDPVNLVDPSGLAVSDIAEWWLYRSELPGPNGSGNPDSWGRGNWNATGAYVKAHGTKAEKIIYGGSLATAIVATTVASASYAAGYYNTVMQGGKILRGVPFRRHALERMTQRGIPPSAVEGAIMMGNVAWNSSNFFRYRSIVEGGGKVGQRGLTVVRNWVTGEVHTVW